MVGALGGLLFGFDTAVIAGTERSLTAIFGLTPAQLGLTVSSALWGTVLGALLGGLLGQWLGGRESLRIVALLYFISAIGCAFAPAWAALILFRVIGGLGIGCSSVIGPVYIAEISPPKYRGLMVGSFQTNIVAGILVAYLCNSFISGLHLGSKEWRWELGVAAAPAILFFLMLFGIPHSPRWLVTQGRVDEARSVLSLLGSADPEAELQSIIKTVRFDKLGGSEPLFIRKYRFPIFLAIALAFFNQLSGINAILYYLNEIFERAGFTQVSGNVQTLIVGLMLLVSTVLAMSAIDRLGRRTLLLVGAVGTTGSLLGICAIFYSSSHQRYLVWLLAVYIFFFAISQGSVIWVYLSEIFPNRVRAKGQSLGSFTHWFMDATLALFFPLMVRRSEAFPFAFFAAATVIQFFVVLFVFPETKGISLEELQTKLQIEA